MVVMVQDYSVKGEHADKIDSVMGYAEDFIIGACAEHGFEDLDITIKLGRGVKQAGSCAYRYDEPYVYTITLSRPFIEQCDFAFMDDTIRHELAHAFAPRGSHHGAQWKHWAKVLGAKPQRCHDTQLEGIHKWKATCDNCGREVRYVRKPRSKRSCGKCNPKTFDERYILEFHKVA